MPLNDWPKNFESSIRALRAIIIHYNPIRPIQHVQQSVHISLLFSSIPSSRST